MIDARETPPGVAPVVTTLPKPFPKDAYRFFDETSEWRASDAIWAYGLGHYAFQVQHPVHSVFTFIPPST